MDDRTKSVILHVAQSWYARGPESLPLTQRTSAHFLVHQAIRRIADGTSMLEAARSACEAFDGEYAAWKELHWLKLYVGPLAWPYSSDYTKESGSLEKRNGAWLEAKRVMQEWLEALEAFEAHEASDIDSESGDDDKS